MSAATIHQSAPSCPRCNGRMWDNRDSKRNPRAPDFKCRDRSCDGALWPGQYTPTEEVGASEAAEASESSSDHEKRVERPSARECYLDVTRFVLGQIRPLYDGAGLPCTDSTVAAIAATLFIATCRAERVRGAA